MSALHSFGTCNILKCSTEIPFAQKDSNSWVSLVASDLGLYDCNHGVKSVDNNYIFHSVCKQLKNITADDLVIVAWTDVSSRMFLNEGAINSEILEYSIVYDTGLVENSNWIRSQGLNNKQWNGNFNHNQTFGNPYYDNYFDQYYNQNIAHLETMQKATALKAILDQQKIKYIFTSSCNLFSTSKISYTDVFQIGNWFYPDNLGIVEYTKFKNLEISKTNCHPSDHGHKQLAEKFLQYYYEL